MVLRSPLRRVRFNGPWTYDPFPEHPSWGSQSAFQKQNEPHHLPPGPDMALKARQAYDKVVADQKKKDAQKDAQFGARA